MQYKLRYCFKYGFNLRRIIATFYGENQTSSSMDKSICPIGFIVHGNFSDTIKKSAQFVPSEKPFLGQTSSQT